jgi:YVTN family beta-propeller protein
MFVSASPANDLANKLANELIELANELIDGSINCQMNDLGHRIEALIYNRLYNRRSSTAKRRIAGAVLYSAPEKLVPIAVARTQRLFRSLSASALLVLTGCGVSYRPVVSAVNPVGPAAQPTKYAIAISQPTTTGPGLLNIVDFSGDTVLTTTSIGAAPKYLTLNSSGTTGYIINSDSTVNTADISTSLISSQIESTTLLSGALPISASAFGAYLYVSENGRNSIGQFNSSQPPALLQELPVSNPVYTVGIDGAVRLYALGNSTAGTGQATAIESASNTVSTVLPVGTNPVYGVMTGDGRRAFIMNKGSNTVSVINAQGNTLDTGHPTIAVGANPVWADIASSTSVLAVLNAGTATANGSVTLVNIPLCALSTPLGNPNCDASSDATGFGTVIGTIPVGKSPQVLSVLQDGTRAYVANFGDTVPCPTLPSSAIPPTKGCGTVSVVDLTTNTIRATIPVAGHPTFIVSTTGSPTGKVYVTSPETSLMTIIRTDLDTVDTYVELQGTGQMVRVTSR